MKTWDGLNEDQRGGHDEISACLGALKGPILRCEVLDEESRIRALSWIEKIREEVKVLRSLTLNVQEERRTLIQLIKDKILTVVNSRHITAAEVLECINIIRKRK